MKVGVPKEIKKQENRVGLVPRSVKEYVNHGHEVCIERGAGAGIGATDDAYRSAGASIIDTAEEVFSSSDMIVKVKEPQPTEWTQLREGQILYTYLHLAPDPEQTKGLLDSGCGRLSVQVAAQSLEKHNGGKGLLIGGVPGVAPAKVVVIGGGNVGTNAAKIAVGMGAEVTILDRSIERMRELDDLFGGRVRTVYSSAGALEDEVAAADVTIGAVLIPGASAPRLVTRDMLSTIEDGSVLVDVAIDQGGCFETSKATTHAEPTYVVDGVVHYCVANMPGAVAKTSSYALNNATLGHGLALANRGLGALDNIHLANGLNVHAGKITNKAVADSLQLDYVSPQSLKLD